MTDRSETTSPAPSAADDDTREHATVATATAITDRPSDDGASTHPRDEEPGTDDHWDDRTDGGDHDGTGPVDGWDDDEWDDAPRETLPERPRRRIVTPATLALVGVVLVGAGFIGGVQVQKGSDDGGGGGGRGAFAGGAGRGQGAAAAGVPGGAGGGAAQATGAPGAAGASGASGGAPGGGTAAGSAGGGAASGSAAGDGTTVGTVANVKGSRLYVTTSDGTTVEVAVGGQATVSRLSKSSAGGVHPGDTIVVQGTTKSDGAVAATSVQAAANGLSLGGGFGARGGAAPGGSGTGGTSSGGSSSGGSSSGGSSSGGSSGAVDQLFGGN